MEEIEIIEFIREIHSSAHSPQVLHGIGDDCAVLSPNPSATVVTTDTLMDGRHFNLESDPLAAIGHKALAVSLSDIAAMGARPTAVFLNLCLPTSMSTSGVKELLRGLVSLANTHSVPIVGGDTNTWDSGLVITTTVHGVPVGKHPIMRSGAQVGDVIMVTGPLGGSFASGHHLNFTPRLAEAAFLAQIGGVGAMADVSDGLASDLRHICNSSAVGALLDAELIPLRKQDLSSCDQMESLRRSLCDGEDFELVLTCSKASAAEICRQSPESMNFTVVGEILKQTGLWATMGGREPFLIDWRGFNHRLNDAEP